MGLNWRKKIKRKNAKRHDEGKQQFYFTSGFIYKIRKIVVTLLCGLVSSLCGFIITWCRFVFVFLASLACPVQVPRLTRYHELVRPVFRWIPVPSLARRLKATKWQKQKIPFAAKYKNRSHLSLDKWTNDSFSPFRTSRLVRNTALRTSVIDRLLLVKIDLRTKLEHCTKIESNNKKTQISGFIIQLHLLQWLDWCYEKKLADNLSYFPDDEDSEWLANIDPSLLDKSNEEKQLDDNDFPAPIPANSVPLCITLSRILRK